MIPTNGRSGLSDHLNSWRTEYAETTLKGVPPSRLWSLKLLNVIVERKDAYTIGHCWRVQGYARALGEALGLTSDELRNLMVAAAFHDIGKIGVISTILNKPGPLDAFQWRVMHMHPVLGRELWEAAAPAIPEVAKIIYQHHERWDGRGYPQRLSGQDIGAEARILGLADAYDAMCSDRPYRPALAETVVFEELHAGAGGQFDPEAVGLFIDIIQDKKVKAA